MKQLKNKWLLVISLIIMFTSIIVIIFVMLKGGKNEVETINNNFLVNISKDDLSDKINNKENFYVYIGRPSCPDCVVFEPKLDVILLDTKRKLFYYNTEAKASEKQGIRDYLETLGVSSIPSILHIDSGQVLELYDVQHDDIVSKFEQDFRMEE